jgi:hypothetical protein
VLIYAVTSNSVRNADEARANTHDYESGLSHI